MLDRRGAVGERVVGAPGAGADLAARAQQHPEAEAGADGHRQAAVDLALGLVEQAALHQVVPEVVARERLLPGLAGLDGQRERVLEAHLEVGDAEVAERQAAHPAREQPQREVARAVG